MIGFGAFLPIELELARVVHLRPSGAGLPPGTGRVTAGVAALSAAAVLVTWPALSPGLGGSTGLLWAMLVLCGVSAGQFVLRGLLLGRGWVGRHGLVLLADSGLRVLGAVVVAATAARPTAADFGWTLVVAIAVAHVPLVLVLVLRSTSVAARSAVAVPAVTTQRLRLRAVGQLMVATLCAQALLNAAPVLVTSAASPGQRAEAAAFVASFTLVRLPLFVAVPLQTVVLPALTEVGASTDHAGQRRLVLRLAGGVGGLAVVAAVVAAVAGRPVVGIVFGPRYALSGAELAVLSAGSIIYLGLLLTTQALVASERHRDSAMAWAAGLVVAVAVFAAVPALVPRVTAAFLAGSGAALLLGTAALVRGRPDAAPESAGFAKGAP